MRSQKIIELFKKVENVVGKDQDQSPFIEFITQKVPDLWAAFQKESSQSKGDGEDHFEDFGSTDMKGDGDRSFPNHHPEHTMD
jgi:hypothetical protein